MARNEEKAQNMLNRWVKMRQDSTKRDMGVRPYLSTECTDLSDCEYWRRDIIKEISRKVQDIQNAGLGEHTLRDMNDAINKLIREKGHWERQIRNLGGPNYSKSAPAIGADGKELPGGGGYMYFGATKDLPGVRELFEAAPVQKKKRSRHEMYKGITPDYYGYRDEDDGVLVLAETEAEAEAVRDELQRWADKKRRKLAEQAEAKKEGKAVQVVVEEEEESEEEEEEEAAVGGSAATSAEYKSHVPVPDQDAIEALILRQKKEALMSKYASADLQDEEKKAKQMLNIKQ